MSGCNWFCWTNVWHCASVFMCMKYTPAFLQVLCTWSRTTSTLSILPGVCEYYILQQLRNDKTQLCPIAAEASWEAETHQSCHLASSWGICLFCWNDLKRGQWAFASAWKDFHLSTYFVEYGNVTVDRAKWIRWWRKKESDNATDSVCKGLRACFSPAMCPQFRSTVRISSRDGGTFPWRKERWDAG